MDEAAYQEEYQESMPELDGTLDGTVYGSPSKPGTLLPYAICAAITACANVSRAANLAAEPMDDLLNRT
jgi:hypothetical protein